MENSNKKGLLIIIAVVLLLAGLCIGYLIGTKQNKREKLQMFLPIYEYNSAADGTLVYSNRFENGVGKVVHKLSSLVPCQYDYCEWVFSGYSTYVDAAWVMQDINDSNSGTQNGGYYVYDYKAKKIIAGPFDSFDFEVPYGEAVSRKAIVEKDGKYGLYDIVTKSFLLELEYDFIGYGDDSNHLYCEKGDKRQFYLFEGELKDLIREEVIGHELE